MLKNFTKKTKREKKLQCSIPAKVIVYVEKKSKKKVIVQDAEKRHCVMCQQVIKSMTEKCHEKGHNWYAQKKVQYNMSKYIMNKSPVCPKILCQKMS